METRIIILIQLDPLSSLTLFQLSNASSILSSFLTVKTETRYYLKRYVISLIQKQSTAETEDKEKIYRIAQQPDSICRERNYEKHEMFCSPLHKWNLICRVPIAFSLLPNILLFAAALKCRALSDILNSFWLFAFLSFIVDIL